MFERLSALLSVILILAATIGCIFALINPNRGLFFLKRRTRKMGCLVYLTVYVVAIALMCVGSPKKSNTGDPQPTSTVVTQNNQQALETFKQELGSGFGNYPWNIIINRYTDDEVAVTLKYTRKPSGYTEVKQHCFAVARHILEVLGRHGRKPADEEIFVFVHAHKDEVGETGKPLVRIFGKAAYNPFTDQLEWEPVYSTKDYLEKNLPF